MLPNTFCHIPGVGLTTEQRFWSAGVHSWELACGGGPLPVTSRKADLVRRQVAVSAAQLAAGNPEYFYETLPAAEHWRLFREFREAVAYLDIETTGLSGPGDSITTIALYDGRVIKHYVQGINLEEFARDIQAYRLLVTYNGKTFDAPFIRGYLGIPLAQAHIDLRYVLASLGYRGGLKGCERQLGLERGELADVDGFFAVLLWNEYRQRRNQRALETLLAYNMTDVVNLATLMTRAYNLKLQATPFLASHALPMPALPEIPFQADVTTIERLRREHPWGAGW